MATEHLIEKTIHHVKTCLSDAEAGHDWFHIERVWKNARFIAQSEGRKIGTAPDLLVVELGALLHDIADSKFHGGDELIGPAQARQFLESHSVNDSITTHVEQIIRNISFKGGRETSSFRSLELDIVQDADRLDAIGAIGIARAFHYGGFKNRKMYDPAVPPNLNMTKEEYKKSDAPTINHFYEKLFLLRDRMNTASGREMADERHRFMEEFVDRFYREWEGAILPD